MPDKTPTLTTSLICGFARADLLRLVLSAQGARTVKDASPAERAFYADVATAAGSMASALEALADEGGAAALHVTPEQLAEAVRDELHKLLGEPSPSGKVGGQ